jgi:hypothetical protein
MIDDSRANISSFCAVMNIPPLPKRDKRPRLEISERDQIVKTLLELAGCGIFDLASLGLDGVIDPIHVHFKKLNAKPGLLLSPVYDAPDQKYPSPRIRTVSTLPGWVKDAFENKVVELIAVVEFLVDYKVFSTHEEKYKEGFTEFGKKSRHCLSTMPSCLP